MNKHTPGPWVSGGCVVWESDCDLICDLSVAERPPDETEANAQLIARAPQQRDALRAIAGMVVDEETNHEHLTALCMSIARAALRAV